MNLCAGGENAEDDFQGQCCLIKKHQIARYSQKSNNPTMPTERLFWQKEENLNLSPTHPPTMQKTKPKQNIRERISLSKANPRIKNQARQPSYQNTNIKYTNNYGLTATSHTPINSSIDYNNIHKINNKKTDFFSFQEQPLQKTVATTVSPFPTHRYYNSKPASSDNRQKVQNLTRKYIHSPLNVPRTNNFNNIIHNTQTEGKVEIQYYKPNSVKNDYYQDHGKIKLSNDKLLHSQKQSNHIKNCQLELYNKGFIRRNSSAPSEKIENLKKEEKQCSRINISQASLSQSIVSKSLQPSELYEENQFSRQDYMKMKSSKQSEGMIEKKSSKKSIKNWKQYRKQVEFFQPFDFENHGFKPIATPKNILRVSGGYDSPNSNLQLKANTAHSVYEQSLIDFETMMKNSSNLNTSNMPEKRRQKQKKVQQSIIVIDFFNPQGKFREIIEEDLKKRQDIH